MLCSVPKKSDRSTVTCGYLEVQVDLSTCCHTIDPSARCQSPSDLVIQSVHLLSVISSCHTVSKVGINLLGLSTICPVILTTHAGIVRATARDERAGAVIAAGSSGYINSHG